MAITATEQEAEELRKAAVSGVQSVEADGRKVVYRSLDDLKRIQGVVEANATPGGTRRRRLAVFRSGW